MDKKDCQTYLTTGMMGTYKPEYAVNRETESGGVLTIFRDVVHTVKDDNWVCDRKMLIRGKCFHVTSVFPYEPTATPTDKLLTLIDTELAKESRGA